MSLLIDREESGGKAEVEHPKRVKGSHVTLCPQSQGEKAFGFLDSAVRQHWLP